MELKDYVLMPKIKRRDTYMKKRGFIISKNTHSIEMKINRTIEN